MLAEPRRRQKLSIDPRNTSWKNDDDKFGKRLMEKMGWTDGKGLGANEDGCQDHIKVSLKNDTRGLGCTASHEDKWIAHQDDFNSLLANLNANHASGDTTPKETAITSLEQKSKKSKKRVHYMKFTKGKDLTGYSSKDMDCIMGRRVSKSEPATPQSQSTQNSDAESVTSCPDYGVTTITRTESVEEYFKKKMMLIQNGRKTKSNEKATDELSDQSDDGIQKASFKTSQSDMEDDSTEETVVKKKKKLKKRKRFEKQTIEVCDDESDPKEEEDQSVKKSLKKKRKQTESNQELSEDLPKKKKKKSKKSKKSIE